MTDSIDKPSTSAISPESIATSSKDLFNDAADEATAKRLADEWLSVEKAFDKANILHTIVFFGSARIEDKHKAELIQEKVKLLSQSQTNLSKSELLKQAKASAELTLKQSRYYEDARQLARLIGEHLYDCENQTTKLVTGGGPGIMEAANRGVAEIGQSSIGLNIIIPREQIPNRYISEEFSFNFRYFSMRKMHFLKRAKVIIVFPGGFGTLDELMEVLTLIQTQKIPPIPIILYGSKYWQKVINFRFLAEQEYIDWEDLNLYQIVDSVKEAFRLAVHCIECIN
ncbi:TIGR00730 family Rossman fold protein [Aliikangiella maris]|uniref:TIGR00730 family Rossman fold protein n=2 Tax=Aliikangiella maris TaxID=3162458 RepID=A0ABV2BVW2_9GAMM